MDYFSIFCLALTVSTTAVAGKMCNIYNILNVGRMVFGEARGEIRTGQLAVAWTVVNRVNHKGYPNNLKSVLFQKETNGRSQYETLDHVGHTDAWNSAKTSNNREYKNAIVAAASALCNIQDDPTACATDFCALDPCPATSSNQYWEVFNKIKIGKHWFACRRHIV